MNVMMMMMKDDDEDDDYDDNDDDDIWYKAAVENIEQSVKCNITSNLSMWDILYYIYGINVGKDARLEIFIKNKWC